MTHFIRGCFIAAAVVASLSATATPAMAQYCYRGLSVLADAAIGDYDENGDAELFVYSSAVDTSSCSTASHVYTTSVCANRIEDGTPVFCGDSESLYAENSSMVDAGVMLNVLARSTLGCEYFPDTFEEEAEFAVQILPLPDGETSEFVTWSTEPFRTAGEFRMTLQVGAGENFAGRQVIEEQFSVGDTCRPGMPQSPFSEAALTGLNNVFVGGNNQWEKDIVGWGEGRVTWYQANRQLSVEQCGFYIAQSMKMNVGPGIFREYHQNLLQAEIFPNKVTSFRANAGDPSGKSWP
jgi:hypothetical protein